ncbi:DUF3237 domain-containing protein [Caulobacter sp. KR2-114]|uniref:DUF3237 domain-containing protein n=1 Tax=Caulobacter sp. KR2-114 TaxID=3400912 RepID=UPI003C11D27C
MPDAAFDALPPALRTLQTRPLFVMRLQVKPLQVVGPQRRIGVVPGGTFDGERLRGEVLDSGVDWQTVSADAVTGLDVRLVLKTHDGALIAMTYQGRRHGPPAVLARLAKGEAVDPTEYYFRIHGGFETTAEPYAWLNGVVAVGTGHRLPEGPVYSLFEVL